MAWFLEYLHINDALEDNIKLNEFRMKGMEIINDDDFELKDCDLTSINKFDEIYLEFKYHIV
jgi:hypothetical protein